MRCDGRITLSNADEKYVPFADVQAFAQKVAPNGSSDAAKLKQQTSIKHPDMLEVLGDRPGNENGRLFVSFPLQLWRLPADAIVDEVSQHGRYMLKGSWTRVPGTTRQMDLRFCFPTLMEDGKPKRIDCGRF